MRYYLFFIVLFYSVINYAQTVEDDFEGTGTISTWFGDDCVIDTNSVNPFKTGINTSPTVLKYTDVGGKFANVRFDTAANFNLAVHHTFSLKIYVSSTNVSGSAPNQISLKLQDKNLTSPWITQTEIIKTIVLNEWQTITFDFANDAYKNLDGSAVAPVNRTDFNRVVLQVNGENNTHKVIAYVDDFLYDGTIDVVGDASEPLFDKLVWSDEFNGEGAINSANWFQQTRPIINGQSWANGEIQHYTNRIENSFVGNGTLKILAKKESYTDIAGVNKQYTSARLNSKFAFTYGKIEIKAKMPTGAGTFPALWMLGQNITENGGYWAATHGTTSWPACGEIDIIEHWGNNQDFVQSAMHNPASFGGTVNKGGRKIVGASTEFHVYSLEWSSKKMIFKVDGIIHYTYNPPNKNASTWPYDAPQYLLMNVAIQPDIVAGFTESALEIDYVRVYQESSLSITEFAVLPKISVYPNPVKDQLTINAPSNLRGFKATIYSVLGREIKSFTQDELEKTYDFSNYKPGTYILKVATKVGVSQHKIVKI